MNDNNIKRTCRHAALATDAIFAMEYVDSVFLPDGVDWAHCGALAALIAYGNFKHSWNWELPLYTQCAFLGIIFSKMT